jgi:hypothetical protein
VSNRVWLLALALGSVACGLGAWAGFALYVNEFSETGRALGDAVLYLSWIGVLLAIGGTVTFAATLALAVADRIRRHA